MRDLPVYLNSEKPRDTKEFLILIAICVVLWVIAVLGCGYYQV